MLVFYSEHIDDNHGLLTGVEARHCSRVLRKKPGDLIRLIDGKGFFYDARITSVGKDTCELEIIESWKQTEKTYKLTIAISPLKNPSRFEWFVEKAVETGVDRIIPVISERTEKPNVNLSRLHNIIVSASKQTLKARFTKLSQVQVFSEFVASIETDQAFIPHLNEKSEYLGKIIVPNSSYTVLIGPEGDFSPREVSDAIDLGILPASLGANRLRTETAGLVAGQIIATINEL